MPNPDVLIIHGRMTGRMPRERHIQIATQTALNITRELRWTNPRIGPDAQAKKIRLAINVQVYGELHETGQWGQEE